MTRARLVDFVQRFGLTLSFLLLCLVLSLLSDRFLTVGNLVNVLRQSTINGIMAIGMTYVILTEGIDLSVSAVLALSTVVTADLLQWSYRRAWRRASHRSSLVCPAKCSNRLGAGCDRRAGSWRYKSILWCGEHWGDDYRGIYYRGDVQWP